VSDPNRVIVVGSGPSGAMAALKLIERGVHVTMLESGDAYPAGLILRAFGRNLFRKWAPPHEGQSYVASGDPTTEWHSALTPGGLSNYWTGAVPRFTPEDFFEGERLHARYRWPLDYIDLAPYYTQAEQILGVVGERRTIPQLSPTGALVTERRLPRAWRALADYAEQLGQGLTYSPIADGPPWLLRASGNAFNSFERIISRLVRDPRFELRLGAHVQRLIWSGINRRVEAVEYVDRSSRATHVLHGAGVVLAAGPLISPKLLLQSVSNDFPHGLGNSHGVLGRYLHDHPKDWCVLELDRGLPRLDQPIYLSRAPYADSEPLMAAQINFGPLSKWDRVLSFGGTTTRSFGVVTFATMLPEAHNRITLHADQRDEFGMPILDIHMRYGDHVQQTVKDAHARMQSILEAAGYRVRLECPVEHLVPGNSAHYAGAARMHSLPEYGVLDGWNRLHDAPNVAVVDASSFTTAVEKNPTLTAMALSARAADRLAHDLAHGQLSASPRQHAVSAVR
jgi:choline dehydrogenase-like flavoprotein